MNVSSNKNPESQAAAQDVTSILHLSKVRGISSPAVKVLQFDVKHVSWPSQNCKTPVFKGWQPGPYTCRSNWPFPNSKHPVRENMRWFWAEILHETETS